MGFEIIQDGLEDKLSSDSCFRRTQSIDQERINLMRELNDSEIDFEDEKVQNDHDLPEKIVEKSK
jgi:hypothetical protein